MQILKMNEMHIFLLGAALAILCLHAISWDADALMTDLDKDNFDTEASVMSGVQVVLSCLAKTFDPHNLGDTQQLVLSWHVAIAALLVAAGALLSSIGGIGGGAVYVAIFNLLLKLDTKTSAALSNFTIFSGMIANMACYFWKQNPDAPNSPLIDYDTALILQPNMLLGISIGVYCNVMFPGWLITMLLVFSLSYMTIRSCRIGLQRWNHESYEKAIKRFPYDEQKACLNTCIIESEEDCQQSVEVKEPLLPSQPSIRQQFPPCKLFLLFALWISFFSVQFLRGEISQELFNLKECGTGYWLITSVQLPLTFIFSTIIIYHSSHNPMKDNAIAFISKLFSGLPAMALFSGILGGTLGIGGGIIINPLLHETGMSPQVTAATCSFIVFFSSSMSMIQFWLLGRVPLDYAAFFSLVCFLFSMIGLQSCQRAMARSGRMSLIIFTVAIVMVISAVLMAFFGTIDAWRDLQQGKNMGFSPPC